MQKFHLRHFLFLKIPTISLNIHLHQIYHEQHNHPTIWGLSLPSHLEPSNTILCPAKCHASKWVVLGCYVVRTPLQVEPESAAFSFQYVPMLVLEMHVPNLLLQEVPPTHLPAHHHSTSIVLLFFYPYWHLHPQNGYKVNEYFCSLWNERLCFLGCTKLTLQSTSLCIIPKVFSFEDTRIQRS